MGFYLPNIAFRFTRNSDKNKESYAETIKILNYSIKKTIDEKNIEIINNYLDLWVKFILSNPSLLDDKYLTEFYTSAKFPEFEIIASMQVTI